MATNDPNVQQARDVVIDLALMAAKIHEQETVIEALRKQIPEPYSYVDLERQDHEAYERNE